MSAPARAWETAVWAKRGRAASLSTVSPERGPQWPWSVYSHRQVSQMTHIRGRASLMALTPCWTTPSRAQAPEPWGSFLFGRPNRITAGTPASQAARASFTAMSGERWNCPARLAMGSLRPLPSTMKRG